MFKQSALRHAVHLAAAAVLLSAAPGLASADDGPPKGRWQSPVGVWKMTVTFVNCGTNAPVRDPFPALNTFFADGNLSEIGAGLGPAFRSGSHGRWRWTGKDTLAIRAEMQLFDSNFLYYADQVMDRRLEVSGDGQSMTGRATFVRYGLDGSVLFQGCALETGTRLPEPAAQN